MVGEQTIDQNPVIDINYNSDANNTIDNPTYVFANLTQFQPSDVIYHYVNHEQFSEDFILSHLSYFTDTIELLVKRKAVLSDAFFEKLCNKSNYSTMKMCRKLKEPMRNFKKLDDLFY